MSKENQKNICFINQSSLLLFSELVDDVCPFFSQCTLIASELDDFPFKNSVIIKRVGSLNRSNIIHRIISWIMFAVLASLLVISQKRGTILVVVSNPPILHWIMPIISKFKGLKYIPLVYDIYPDMLEGKALFGVGNSILVRCWHQLNGISYKSAASVLTITNGMKDRIRSNYDLPESLFKVFPTWVDTQRFVPISRFLNRFRKLNELGDKIIVMYSGNIGVSHDISWLPAVAKSFFYRDDLVFIVIGKGSKFQQLKEDVKILDNVIVFDPLATSEFVEALASADVAIISMADHTDNKMFPSKIYNSMAVGSMLLGVSPKNGELYEFIKDNQVGLAFDSKDSKDITEGLEKVLRNPNILDFYKKNSRAIAIQEYSRSKVALEIAEYLVRL